MLRGVLQTSRRLQAEGIASSDLVHRLVSEFVSSARCRALIHCTADCTPPVVWRSNDGGVRGLNTEVVQEDLKQQQSVDDRDEYVTTKFKHVAPSEKGKHAGAYPAKQQWWRPDSETGCWVPEDYQGQVTTSTKEMKSPSRQSRIRTEIGKSLEDKTWWTSMEELPDRFSRKKLTPEETKWDH